MQKIITKHSKNITSSLKNIKRHLTGEEKILRLSFKNITLSFGILIYGFLFSNSVFADTVDYTVNVAPSLNISLSGDIDTTSNNVVLNLNPNNHTSDSKNVTITVGTNNITGYKLIMSTVDDSTDLVRDNTDNLGNATIPTLATDTSFASLADFPANKWGYKKDSGNFIPFTSNTKLLENHTATNEDSTTLTFASKIDYDQMAGRYAATLAFTATANPLLPYLQDYDKTTCATEASSNSITLYDGRDLNDYQVRYIKGNCWMVQNLRYKGDVGSTSGSMIMESATSNIDADKTIIYADLTAGNTYDVARIHDSGNTTNGVYYNYAAASAMTITGSNNTKAQSYDICPKGWRLPTYSEQSGITGQATAYVPITGGYHSSGIIQGTGYGYWWASTPGSNTSRYNLRYSSSLSLYTNENGYRYDGFYIRCIRSS